MAPGTTEGPSPPPERESRLQEWIDFVRCSGLIGLVRSARLPALIQYSLRPPPPPTSDAGPPTPVGYGTRRAGHAHITPPRGLADILRDSTPKAGDARPPRAAVGSADDNEYRALLTALPLTGGSPLVEIFGVSVDFPFVGTILICDGRCCNTVYQREDWGGEYKKFFSKKKKWLSSDIRNSSLFGFQDKLLLTGPSRNISLTRTIVTNRGRVHVTCAVVTHAAEAYVEVMLRLPFEATAVRAAKVHGHISARIDTFSIGCKLFSKDVHEAVDVSISGDSLQPQGHSELCQPIFLPLDRSVLAVPVGGCIQVNGELVFNGSNVVSIDHSIRIEGEMTQSQWVQDNYCHTSVHVMIRDC
ncbi:hypothetical protein ACQ4PT_012505 [Festuca glaucescens]